METLLQDVRYALRSLRRSPLFVVTVLVIVSLGTGVPITAIAVEQAGTQGLIVAWLGIVGALAHGASAPLAVGLEIPGARILFPFLILFALWCLLAGLWPLGERVDRTIEDDPVRA